MMIWSHPVWVRGLKPLLCSIPRCECRVAPRVGAWIETSCRWRPTTPCRSHPVWVRGLKLPYALAVDECNASHPVWVRGLKRTQFSDFALPEYVAPRVGAWIETFHLSCDGKDKTVAPRVGAWIETEMTKSISRTRQSHPVWVRGLKPQKVNLLALMLLSHPVWVRGLKLLCSLLTSLEYMSHPVWVRGLKQNWYDDNYARI